MSDTPDYSAPRLVTVLCIVTAMTNMCALTVYIVSPHIRDALQLRADAFGLLLSVGLGAGIVGSLSAGWLADRGHMRKTFHAALALLAITYATCSFPPSYARYLIAFTCAGMANTALTTLASVGVTRAYPEGSRKPLTWLLIGYSLAGIVGPPFWGYLFQAFTSVVGGARSLQFVFACALGACALAWAILALNPVPARVAGTGTKKEDVQPGDIPLLGLPLVLVCVFAALHASADNAMFVWIPEFTRAHFSPQPFPSSWILSGVAAAYVLGRLVLLSAPDRLRDLTVITAVAGTSAVLFMLAFNSPNQYLMAGLYVLGGVLLSADYPSIMSYTASMFKRGTGSALAITGAASAGASLLVPPLVGYISEVTGSLVTAMMLPPALLLLLALLAFLRKITETRGRAPT